MCDDKDDIKYKLYLIGWDLSPEHVLVHFVLRESREVNA